MPAQLTEIDKWGANTLCFSWVLENVHIKMTDVSIQQRFGHRPHGNTDKDCEINRPPTALWSLCSRSAYAASGLWPSSEFPTLSVTVFYVVHKPRRPSITRHQRSLNIIHFYLFIFSTYPIFMESNHKGRKSLDPPLWERCSRAHNKPSILQWIVASSNVARFLAVATKVRVHLFSWGVSRGGGRQIAESCGVAILAESLILLKPPSSVPLLASGSSRGEGLGGVSAHGCTIKI